ncbi:uncharacterized protein DDB_G0283697-like [Pseudomyrmex gracilis]|uniref:uncharacterized protein DDB_G0283697-like n=1 Tax=Pseudomyrmex gracilis TaxID=219809 RepID=UPI000994E905|nr:uncharacterized protein DDB_G0283697-like [Pseudomyrmex gracilis]
MAPIKRHRNARSRQGMSQRRRKPNICKLIYKFLVTNQAAYDTKCAAKHRWWDEEGHDDEEEVVESADTLQRDKKMDRGTRRNHGKVAKSRNQRALKDLPISYLRKCVGGEGTTGTTARKYVKRALDFGVKSGFLIPSDSSSKVLRVSSDLMKSDTQNRISTCDRDALSKDHGIPTKLDDDLQVQEQRRRRRRRGRSRTRSRSRSRRRGRRRRGRRGRRRRSRSAKYRSRSRSRSDTKNIVSPQSPEEVVEDDEANDYEMDENDPKSDIHIDGVERESKTERSGKHDDDEKEPTKKSERNRSDLSADEDESGGDDDDDDDDDDEDKKRIDIAKS